jgi:hypothetical protein
VRVCHADIQSIEQRNAHVLHRYLMCRCRGADVGDLVLRMEGTTICNRWRIANHSRRWELYWFWLDTRYGKMLPDGLRREDAFGFGMMQGMISCRVPLAAVFLALWPAVEWRISQRRQPVKDRYPHDAAN